MADYTLSVKITGDSSNFDNALANAQKVVDNFNNGMSSMSSRFQAVGDRLISFGAKWTLGVTTPIVAGTKAAINAASDYDENLNKIDVAFGDSARAVKNWSETALTSFGLSKNQALEAAALFGDMATSMGITQQEASNMATSLSGLAGDLASFKNIGIEQAMTALAGVFTGETESLKQLGIVMTETNLEEFAARTGQVYSQMSQAEKVQLRYNYVLAMSKNAIGDYERTADGTANSIRTFQGSVENLSIAFGQKLLPTFTPIIQDATKLINKFANLDAETQNVIVKAGLLAAAMGPISTITGAASKGVGKLITTYQKFNGAVKTMNRARAAVLNYQAATEGASLAAGVANGQLTKQQAVVGGLSNKVGTLVKKLAGLAVANPWAVAIAGAAALGGAIYAIVDAQNKATNAAEDFLKANSANISEIKAQSEEASFYAQKLDELSQKENKSAQDKELIKGYVDRLNESVDGLNLKYDEEKDKLNQTTDAIYDKINAMKEEALQSAYIKQSQEALDKYAESQIKLTEAQEKYADVQKQYDEAVSTGYVSQQLSKDLQTAKTNYNDLKAATTSYWTEYLKQSNNAAMASGQWDSLVAQAEAAGINIPKSLITGIKNGQYAIPTTLEELKALIQFNDLAQRATGDGKRIVDNLSAQLAAGNITAAEATAKLTAAVDGQLSAEAGRASGQGAKTANTFAGAISAGAGAARSAGVTIGNAANSGAGSVSSYSTGLNFSNGLARGIAAGAYAVRAAAESVAAQALAAAKREAQTGSPSKKWDRELGQMDAAGLARGLFKGIPKVKAAGTALAEAAFDMAADNSIDIRSASSISQNLAVDTAMRLANVTTKPSTNDIAGLGDYIIAGVTEQGKLIADALEKGVGNIRMVPNDRNMARYIGKLGFERS